MNKPSYRSLDFGSFWPIFPGVRAELLVSAESNDGFSGKALSLKGGDTQRNILFDKFTVQISKLSSINFYQVKENKQ